MLEGMAVSFLTHKESERDQRLIEYLDERIHELAGLPMRAAKS